MTLPITQPLLSIELHSIIKADTQPIPPTDYQATLIVDLGYTKLWLIYKIIS